MSHMLTNQKMCAHKLFVYKRWWRVKTKKLVHLHEKKQRPAKKMNREIKRILWLEEVIKLGDISEFNDYTAVVVSMKPSQPILSNQTFNK